MSEEKPPVKTLVKPLPDSFFDDSDDEYDPIAVFLTAMPNIKAAHKGRAGKWFKKH